MRSPQTLELRTTGGRPRHWLGDRPVNGGDALELCFSGGWVVGRYEWDAEKQERPLFHCSIVLQEGDVAETVIEIPDGAVMRWP